MLRIGKLTDYSLLIMSELAKAPHSLQSATTLANRLHLPVPTVSKILKMLSDGCLLQSVRGAGGGYRLAKNATSITVAHIIAVMEGDFALTECCEKKGRCVIDSMCLLRGNWRTINKLLYAFLNKLTIVDMSKPMPGLKQIEMEYR